MNISYAQNYEDILIHRLFSEGNNGFYIDIGAAHPVKDSVTLFFYSKGWSGINIEPNINYHKLLKKYRKRDINLHCAVSDKRERINYYLVKDDPKISYIAKDKKSTGVYKEFLQDCIPMETRTLMDIVAEFSPPKIDFLKIDVEGAEESVLKGIDFQELNPRLVVIESVEVKGVQKNNQHWEKLLVDQGYISVYFDGSNSYYVKKTDLEAIQIYSTPLNASDQFIQYNQLKFRSYLKIMKRRLFDKFINKY